MINTEAGIATAGERGYALMMRALNLQGLVEMIIIDAYFVKQKFDLTRKHISKIHMRKIVMKKAALAVALAGGLGVTGAANAVNVNPDGLGEVLLYSMYTVNGGNDTLINITNTQNEVKAVKIRFLEGMNSQEVLDFNLYLSPYDVWTGAITRTENGAKLVTGDNSCTVPPIPEAGVEFRNYEYLGDNYHLGEGGPQGTDRTRVGHIEAIEMGVVTDNSFTDAPLSAFNPDDWATHAANGIPAFCGGLTIGWTDVWGVAAPANLLISAPTGGLYGSATIINVPEATAAGYDAEALDNWAVPGIPQHTAPGSTSPDLGGGTQLAVLPGGVSITAATGWDAVSTVLQQRAIANDYITVDALGAETDWAVTFPTKFFYVNNYAPAPALPVTGAGPFTVPWTAASVGDVAGSACEPIDISYWDQEEGEQSPDPLDFSPPRPGPAGFALCWEANILSVNGSDVLGAGYTRSNLDLAEGFDAGWIRLGMAGTNDQNTRVQQIVHPSGEYTAGLPVIGEAFVTYTNGGATEGGATNNYGAAFEHKGSGTEVTTAPTAGSSPL